MAVAALRPNASAVAFRTIHFDDLRTAKSVSTKLRRSS